MNSSCKNDSDREGPYDVNFLLFVAPAERRHHERKLAILQKKIDDREARRDEDEDVAGDQDNAPKEP